LFNDFNKIYAEQPPTLNTNTIVLIANNTPSEELFSGEHLFLQRGGNIIIIQMFRLTAASILTATAALWVGSAGAAPWRHRIQATPQHRSKW
jgi:hypothetical protein